MPSRPTHLQAALLGAAAEDLGDALAVDLAVVEHEDALDAHLLGPVGRHLALDVVGRDHADVVDLAGRTVGRRLVGLAHAGLGELDRGVGRADHHQVRLVEDRHRHLGGAGVEGADVDHHVGVAHRLVGVGGLDRGVPVAALRRGVVPVLVLDGEVADLAADLVDRQLDAVDERGRSARWRCPCAAGWRRS